MAEAVAFPVFPPLHVTLTEEETLDVGPGIVPTATLEETVHPFPSVTVTV